MKRSRQVTTIRIRKPSSSQQEQQTRRKRTRYSFLGDKEQLLYFPIPTSIHVDSPRVPNDCVICSLRYLNVITTSQATQLRKHLIQRTDVQGLEMSSIIRILKHKMQAKYSRVEFRSIAYPNTKFLFDDIPPNHAFVVRLGAKKNSRTSVGHMIVLFKDGGGQLGLIDPQNDFRCYRDQCMTYLDHFDNEELTVFVGTPKK